MFEAGLRFLVVIPLILGLGAPAAAVETKEQKACLNALLKAGANVARTVTGELAGCLKSASKGKLPDGDTADDCLTADYRHRLARAQAKTTKAATANCSVLPSFGPTSAIVVNLSFTPLRLVEKLFGPSLDAAVADAGTDRGAAVCQGAVAKAVGKLVGARLKSFALCAKSGLKDDSLETAEGLTDCLDADVGGKVTHLELKMRRLLERKCGAADLAAALPGECAGGGAEGLLDCVSPRIACDACRNASDASGLGATCDPYVDGVADPRCSDVPTTTQSAARQWNEELLGAIRISVPRPVVHARNLFHVSAAMWDAWRAWDPTGTAYFLDETGDPSPDVEADRATAISFAAYRVLVHRYGPSVNGPTALASFAARMAAMGYDPNFTSTDGNSPAAIGNRIGAAAIAFGATDGANEQDNYADPTYTPVNDPLIVKLPGAEMNDPNRWQPLSLDFFVSQNGIPLPISVQTFVGSHWGGVTGFALPPAPPGGLHIDPGQPPQLGGVDDALYKDQFVQVIEFSSHLDPDDPALIDISPGVIHNNTLGTEDGSGYPVNPYTGQPYAPNVVRLGDYGRILAEFWADGPTSETPPGHWNVIANYVSDHPLLVKRIQGTGPVVNDLEWDVKTYFGLNGAVHDAAIAAWGAKRYYDYVRPISAIRYMGGLGQSSDPLGDSYDPDGLPLVPGLIEVITPASSAPGERHEHLADHVGEIAIKAWAGNPGDPVNEYGGVAWIRAVEWVPYQRETFVTPPFAAYVSGHSTFSRAGAEYLTEFTGDSYYPGGLGEWHFPADTALFFEKGPSTDITLQWARYYDSSDEAGISRLWGGIHVRPDDFEGRIMGATIGMEAFDLALQYFQGTVAP